MWPRPGRIRITRPWSTRCALPVTTFLIGANPDSTFPTARLDYIEALHGIDASAQFQRDLRAIEAADVVVLLLPAGASAHAEAAWAAAKDKQVIVYLGDEKPQPELMHRLFNGFVENIDQLLFVLSSAQAADARGDVTTIEGYRLAP